MNDFSWNEWFTSLKVVWWQRFGVSYEDVGYDDGAWHNMYNDGLTPSEAVQAEYDAMCALGM